MAVTRSPALVILVGASLVCATARVGRAQSRPFLYSVLPGASGSAQGGRVVYGDIGYGNHLFAAVGPEKLEHRAGAQVALSRRVTVLAQLGWAMNDAQVRGRVGGGAEILARLSAPTGHTVVAVGLGGGQDYRRSVVARGRVVLGYVGKRTRVVGNLNLERPIAAAPGDTRDEVDVNTTLGVSHEFKNNLRLGVESVAEDLEGFFEEDEAEGGAKLMLGPSVGLGSRASRWNVTVAAGPVVQLTRSTASGSGSGAARVLNQTSGYVLRTSLSYEW
jgi:hypothetical protein